MAPTITDSGPNNLAPDKERRDSEPCNYYSGVKNFHTCLPLQLYCLEWNK
jgi:hypothetical protein